MYYNLYIC